MYKMWQQLFNKKGNRKMRSLILSYFLSLQETSLPNREVFRNNFGYKYLLPPYEAPLERLISQIQTLRQPIFPFCK